MDEDILVTNIGEIPDKTIKLEVSFVALIALCTSMQMYIDFIEELIERKEVSQEVGERMLQHVQETLTEFKHIMVVEGNEGIRAIFEEVEGTIQ